jgi:hypothetical protein
MQYEEAVEISVQRLDGNDVVLQTCAGALTAAEWYPPPPTSRETSSTG